MKGSSLTGIGIRVYSYSKVYYSIIEKLADDTLNYLDISHVNVPLALERPERLNFIRNTILDIMTAYKVNRAVIRIAEYGGTINNSAIERFYLEGVIQESLASCDVEKFEAGQISRLSNLAGFEKKKFKKLADGELDFEDLPEEIIWKQLKLENRESILACYAAIKL